MREDSKLLFKEYYRNLVKNDPDVSKELTNNLARVESTGAWPPENDFQLEAIVLRQGRPVLDIKEGAAEIVIQEVESQVWKDRLTIAAESLKKHIPAVGRIEVSNHPRGIPWLGTGWLIRDDIVVTNRHVAEIFGEASARGAKFDFRPGLDGNPMNAKIDFIEEFDSVASHESPVFEIVHIEQGGGPDVAFLRIQSKPGHALPPSVPIATDPISDGQHVAVIGYPARDPFFPEPALMDEIFKHRYDKKRLAPGLVTGQTSVRLFHDCSTLGGNSGGEIVSLETGKAIALHFAGTLFQRNHAVPIAIVLERLEAALRGNPTRSSQNRRSNDPEVNIGTTNGIKLQSTLQGSNGRVIEATVPIHIRIEIGDLVSANGTGALSNAVATSASTLTADDDTFATTEARPEDYLDRPGYDPKFLGDDLEVPLPILVEDEDDTLTFESQGETKQILDYQHFSVLMSRSRRMCRFSAVNIDGKTSQRTTRTGWQYDPRIPKAQQIMKECYGNAPRFSRGHMTRREDPAWGSKADLGNRDSMHATNAVPQMQIFNAGVWLALEDYALQNARQDDMRLCVFTGPFLERNDPIRFEVKVPITFWKVIAFIHDETGELCATGYTMSQKSFISDEQEEFVFGRHESSQRPIREIERRAGLSFGILSDLDPLNESTESQLLPLTSLGQIRFF